MDVIKRVLFELRSLFPISSLSSCVLSDKLFNLSEPHLPHMNNEDTSNRALKVFPGGTVVKNPPANAGDTALVREDPTCRRAAKSMHHNYWTCALEPASHNYSARVLQLLKPTCLEPMLHSKEKPLQREAHAPQQRVAPARHN